MLTPVSARAQSETKASGATRVDNRAADLFRSGLKKYDERDYEGAVKDLRRSWELSPRYRVLYLIGKTHDRLEQPAEALEAFERYLVDGRDRVPKNRREEVEARVEELKSVVARLRIKANVKGATIRIDGRKVGETPRTEVLRVDPGRRRVVLVKSGFKTTEKFITLAEKQEAELAFELVAWPPPTDGDEDDDDDDTALYVAWITAGTLAAGTVGLAVLTFSGESTLEQLRANPDTPEQDIEDVETRNTALAITTGVVAGLTVLSAGMALYLTLWADDDEPPAASIRLSPGGIGIRGAF